MNRDAPASSEPVWYVQAQGRVWGPYAESRIAAFVGEGRVAAGTLLASSPDGPFGAAGSQPALRRLFAAEEANPELALAQTPRSVLATQAMETPAGAARPLLVFATLTTLDADAFEAALAMHGPYERARAGLWLVRARLGPAALRNALSRRLRGADTLLVVEASLEQAAWFNLDGAEERRLRALWAG
jgi:hypothetical protein